jgi:tRNA pseudouridine32 synthase/23S rRNA pseudouridine746 synthase
MSCVFPVGSSRGAVTNPGLWPYLRSQGLARNHRQASYWVMTPEETRARLLYRDGLMLVIDKPAGVAVHKGPKGGPSLEDDFDALRFGLPRKPALAHRLDRETAGCLVLGRHHKALEQLGLLFKQGKIGKAYWAIVEGGPQEPDGLIDLPLGRLDPSRGWWMKVEPGGLPAQTRWRVLGRGEIEGGAVTWLELEPLTGRTHQLRVHCAAQGWPIAGDSVYGTAPRGDGSTVRLQLLARRVSVPLAKNKPAIVVEAPPPAHMLEALALCGFAGDPSPAIAEVEPAPAIAP